MRVIKISITMWVLLGAMTMVGCKNDGNTNTDGGNDASKKDSAVSDDATGDASVSDDGHHDDGNIAHDVIASETSSEDGAVDVIADQDPDLCIPSTEVCDKQDNDCNGFVDDVDAAKDGIYDCLNILLVGNQGAYGSSDFQAWLKSNGTTVTRIHMSGNNASKLDAAALKDYQIVIFDQMSRAYDAAEAQAVFDWVSAGGGLMAMSGYTGGDPGANANSILGKLGLKFANPLVNGPVKTFATHPITNGITSVTFNGGYYIEIDTSVTGGTNTTIGELTGGPIAIAQERGQGRVFLWGDEWIEFDSVWKSSAEIPKFWANILGWLGKFI